MIKVFYIEDNNGQYVSADGSKRWTRLTGQALYDFLQTERGKLTQNDLQNFYTHLKTTGRLQYTEQQGNGLSDRMVRGCHASCRMALEKAVKEGLITMNPAIGCKLPPKKAREMQILTHDEMQRFLIQAKHDGYYEIFLLDLST